MLDTAAQHDALEVVIGQGPRDVVHDQRLALHDVRLDVAWRVSPRLTLWAAGGGRWIKNRIVYRDRTGTAITILNPSIHHRNETITGWNDVELGAEVGWRWRGLALRPRLGVTLPTGVTVTDPFALGNLGVAHQHVQTGTGTIDLLASLTMTTSWRGWQFAGGLWTRQIAYANTNGYQGGSRYAASTSVGHALFAGISLRGTAELSRESAETWGGKRYVEDGNLGRTDVLFGAAMQAQLAPQLAIEAAFKVPAYVNVVGGQITYPAIFSLALTFSPLTRAAPVAAVHAHDEHDHDSHDEHNHDADGHAEHSDDETSHIHAEHRDPNAHAALPADPASLPANVIRLDPQKHDLQLASTGLTVVDYSAVWCAPCMVLTPQLIALLARHPSVAMRIADVSDNESALTQGEFDTQSFSLPMVTIFDGKGRKLKTFTGSPALMLAQIKDFLTHY